MFALGGVQPTIKLAAFKGLPVTKAVGILWVVSWVVVEVLGLLAKDVGIGPGGGGSADASSTSDSRRIETNQTRSSRKTQRYSIVHFRDDEVDDSLH